MSEKKEIQPLDPVAFAVAMICGPLLVTICTFWLYFIPAIALLIGGIPYLVIGTPMALWMAFTGPVNAGRGAQWACITILCIAVLAACVAGLTSGKDEAIVILTIGVFSMAFGAAWAATTGCIYSAMTTPEPKPI